MSGFIDKMLWMNWGAPSLTINGSREIGLFVASISSLFIRLQYNKPSVLVKNLFAVYRRHPNPSR
jgi:hypothetical protein